MCAPAKNVAIRPVMPGDLPRLEEIRGLAFAPIFASFRSILGADLYGLVLAREDAQQGSLLASLFEPDSGWEIHVAQLEASVVGFVSLRMSVATGVGEIGLNAVDPSHAGRGIGTAMYEFTISRMKNAGLLAATVATGGDPSHAPARRAYEKAGFTLQIPSVWMCRKL